MVTYNKKNTPKKATILGLGLDSKDGHARVTQGENYYLCGGSEETHEKMVETSIKFNEKLDSKGKHLEDLSRDEFLDMMHNSNE